MRQTRIERHADAPVDAVFRVAGDTKGFQEAMPSVVDVTFLPDTKRSVGMRHRENRRAGSRTSRLKMDAAEFVENDRFRTESHSKGARWLSTFVVEEDGSGAKLRFEMVAEPTSLFGRRVVPLMRGVMTSELAKDMDAVKSHRTTRPTEVGGSAAAPAP